MTKGKEFKGKCVSMATPSGGLVIFGIGEITTMADEKMDAVHIIVRDPQGEDVINASLSKPTYEVFLLAMGEALGAATPMNEKTLVETIAELSDSQMRAIKGAKLIGGRWLLPVYRDRGVLAASIDALDLSEGGFLNFKGIAVRDYLIGVEQP